MYRKLILGNWKMHGSFAFNAALLSALRERVQTEASEVEVGVCVPALYLEQVRRALQGSAVAWGVQDVSAHTHGAFTGEISAAMVAEFGTRFALVGHSERRVHHGESDASIGLKASRALAAGIVPVVCVGESLAEREAEVTEAVVSTQLRGVLDHLELDEARNVVVAYEPVWAIGTGRSASVEQAQAVHSHLRSVLRDHHPSLTSVRIIYGGSIKPENAHPLLHSQDIDGGLVGGASLTPQDFLSIVESGARSCDTPKA